MKTRTIIILAGLSMGGAVALLLLSASAIPASPSAPHEATSCIKVDDLTWQSNSIQGSVTNRCDHTISSAEIDLQLVKDHYIAESVTTFASNLRPGTYTSFDVPTRHYAFDGRYEPIVAAVQEY